jgi:hypothetical protein
LIGILKIDAYGQTTCQAGYLYIPVADLLRYQ